MYNTNELMYVTMTKYYNGTPQEKWVFECESEEEALTVMNNARLLQVFKQIRKRYPVHGRRPYYPNMPTMYMDKRNQPSFYEYRETLAVADTPIEQVMKALDASGAKAEHIRVDIVLNHPMDRAMADFIKDRLEGFEYSTIEGFPALVHEEFNIAITSYGNQKVNFDRQRQTEREKAIESAPIVKPEENDGGMVF